MRLPTALLLGAIAAVPFLLAGPLAAEETPTAQAPTYVLKLTDDATRFHVTRERDRATMLITLRGNASIETPPTLVLRGTPEAQPVTVQAIAEGRGTWRVTHDLLKAEAIYGTISVQIGDKQHSAPLDLVALRAPKHGGHLVAICGGEVEIKHAPAEGALTLYADVDVKFEAPPLLVLSEPRAAEVRFVAVEGQDSVWMIKNEHLGNPKARGVLRVDFGGKPCEEAIPFVGAHGGRIVTWAQGPRYELVPDTGTIYFIDETWDGKPYTIEEPTVVWGSGETARIVRLEPVPSEPRAFRVVGANARFTDPGDARLRLNLLGKTLETSLGASGASVGIR